MPHPYDSAPNSSLLSFVGEYLQRHIDIANTGETVEQTYAALLSLHTAPVSSELGLILLTMFELSYAESQAVARAFLPLRIAFAAMEEDDR